MFINKYSDTFTYICSVLLIYIVMYITILKTEALKHDFG